MQYDIFLGFRFPPEDRWKGDHVVADLSEFAKRKYSPILAGMNSLTAHLARLRGFVEAKQALSSR